MACPGHKFLRCLNSVLDLHWNFAQTFITIEAEHHFLVVGPFGFIREGHFEPLLYFDEFSH
jgi:hypothetical protein